MIAAVRRQLQYEARRRADTQPLTATCVALALLAGIVAVVFAGVAA